MTTPARGISRRSLALGAAWSVPAIAVVAAAPARATSVLPTEPTNVFAVKVIPGCSTTVTWSGIAGEEYQVEYSTDGTNFTGTTTVTSASTSFTNTFASPQGIVAVRVRHIGAGSQYSNWVSATIDVPVPSPFGVVRSGPFLFWYNYAATWGAVPGATQYDLEATTSAGDSGWVDIYQGSDTSYEVARGFWLSQYQQFRVRALVCGVWSPWGVVGVGASSALARSASTEAEPNFDKESLETMPSQEGLKQQQAAATSDLPLSTEQTAVVGKDAAPSSSSPVNDAPDNAQVLEPVPSPSSSVTSPPPTEPTAAAGVSGPVEAAPAAASVVEETATVEGAEA